MQKPKDNFSSATFTSMYVWSASIPVARNACNRSPERTGT